MTIREAFAVDTANAISVGGTSISSNVPDMESLPPIAATSNSAWALSAPRSAANGLPHFSGLSPVRPKYSWNDNHACLGLIPAATSFDIASMTAAIAPLYGDKEDSSGS